MNNVAYMCNVVDALVYMTVHVSSHGMQPIMTEHLSMENNIQLFQQLALLCKCWHWNAKLPCL